MSTPKEALRRLDLDAAKGLAIILVVAGHVVARDIKPLGNDWYAWSNARLYTFHMAFFFFLAGWVYFLRPLEAWSARWVRTAGRLVPAYLLFAAAVFVAKQAAALFVPVDRPIGQWLSELTLQVLYPTKGFASFLWFIVVLLQIQWAAPALLAALRGRWVWALLIAAVLHAAALAGWVTELFALNVACRYFLFFMFGLVVVKRPSGFAVLSRYWFVALLVLLGLLVWLPVHYLVTVAALASLPVLTGLAFSLYRAGLGRWLIFLGVNSFTIYLMNSLCMGGVRAVVLRTSGWDGALFPWVAALLLLCGLLLPIVAQRLLFARVGALDRITR